MILKFKMCQVFSGRHRDRYEKHRKCFEIISIQTPLFSTASPTASMASPPASMAGSYTSYDFD
jgi:hypothetical protein